MTAKPKLKLVYVTATDAKTRKSVAITVYDATPKQVIDLVEKHVKAAK